MIDCSYGAANESRPLNIGFLGCQGKRDERLNRRFGCLLEKVITPVFNGLGGILIGGDAD
jgi:hypothetical protein